MVHVLRDAAEQKSVRELLFEDGKRLHLFAASAEGRRSLMNRELASRRAAAAQRRLESTENDRP